MACRDVQVAPNPGEGDMPNPRNCQPVGLLAGRLVTLALLTSLGMLLMTSSLSSPQSFVQEVNGPSNTKLDEVANDLPGTLGGLGQDTLYDPSDVTTPAWSLDNPGAGVVLAAPGLAGPSALHTLYLPLVAKGAGGAFDWPQFRHDAQHTAATAQELSGNLTIRWKRGFSAWPHVFAELAIVEGRVYFANTDGKITCLDGDNGNILWEYDTGAPIMTTPAVVDGRVHVVNLKGRLVTLDTNGRLLWEYTVPGDVYANPVVAGGKVFLGTVNGTFYAFDAANGGTGPAWSYPVGAMIDTAPVEIGGKVVFAAENMTAYALSVSDGALVWTAALPGARTWNGHPVASIATNKVFFSMITEFYEPSSTHREVFSMYDFENRGGSLSDMAVFADQFISQNRSRLQPAVILDASTGQAVTSYTVAPNNVTIGGLPFNSWYWGSIRPALWQGNKLFLQSMWRNILVDLSTNHIYQPNADQGQTMQFVRGDEQVPVSIGNNRVYGGIGPNVAYLDLTNGQDGNVFGTCGADSCYSTPLTPPLSPDHYMTFPGAGYSDRIGTFVVANGHGYYQQYGWIYCFDGVVVP